MASEVTDVGRTKIMQTGRIREKGGSIGEGKEGGILFKPPSSLRTPLSDSAGQDRPFPATILLWILSITDTE